MKEATEEIREILYYFNSIGVCWKHIETNFYLLYWDKNTKIVHLGKTVKKANNFRLSLSKQGITIYAAKDVEGAKKVVGRAKIPDSLKMLKLLEDNGKVSSKLAKHAGVKEPSTAVYNLTKRGYSIGRVKTGTGLIIYTYDLPKQNII